MAQETVPVSSQRSWLALTLSFENLSSDDIFSEPGLQSNIKNGHLRGASDSPWLTLNLVASNGFTFSFCCLLPFSLLFNSPLMGHELY